MARETPVHLMARTLYRESLAATGHSWQRLNGALFALVRIAITAGVEFAEDDIRACARDCQGGYWFGVDGPENWYSVAVEVGNLSACASIEHYLKRPRWRIDGAILHVGAEIKWDGHTCKVTSLGAESISACHYKAKASHTERDKIERRYTITAEDIAAAANAGRERRAEAFAKAAREWADKGGTLAEVEAKTDREMKRAVERLGFTPTKANAQALVSAMRAATGGQQS